MYNINQLTINYYFGYMSNKFIDFKERKGERNTDFCCSIYSCIHWLILVCALARDCVWGQHSNQLSYPARASKFLKLS